MNEHPFKVGDIVKLITLDHDEIEWDSIGLNRSRFSTEEAYTVIESNGSKYIMLSNGFYCYGSWFRSVFETVDYEEIE